MAAQFEVGDRVRVNVPGEEQHGKEGVVHSTFGSSACNVQIDGMTYPLNYYFRELEPVEDEIEQATHRWTVKTQDNTLGIDVGANAVDITPAGVLTFIIDGRIDVAFAANYWTDLQYEYEETKEEA